MKQILTFIILSREPEDSRELSRALIAQGGVSTLLTTDDPEQAYTETARLRPSAIVVALPASAEPTLKLVRRIAAECPATAVICASRDTSPDIILPSLRSGARDFLRLPVLDTELKTVLERTAEFAAEQEAHNEPKKRGRVVSIFSNKGGCGCSLIATNLAVALNAPTALLDLNLQAGDLELLLGLRPKFSLTDVVENRARLDDKLLASYLTPYSKDLSLLAAPLAAHAAEDIEPRHIFEVLEMLRERFDYVVVDTPHSFDAVTLAALDHSDQILVALTLEIHAIRSTRRALEIFDRLGYPRSKVRVVVNRWSKNVELDQQQIERFLGERVVGFIQSDYRAAVNSINLGQPLLESAPSSKVAADIRQIAGVLFEGAVGEAPQPEPRRRSLNSIFRRQPERENLSLAPALDRVTLDKAKA